VSYQVFARKYRPQTFDSVVGQQHITRTLKNAIEQNRLAHAYLFVGPRGVGKTSTARILAKALNCVQGPTVTPCGKCDPCREIAQGNSLDVLEVDGASNNGVEQVRELRDNVRFAPTRGKFKIYIIDEVHMLTSAAFNALLKTLEEPPAHVKFIFATTEPQKVLPTILSRCQRFDLRRIPAALIAEHLQFIAREEKIELEPAAAQTIARGAEGGLRDAESMLDQLVAFCGGKITDADVLSVFGFTAQQTVADLCGSVLRNSCPDALAIVHAQSEAGRDFSRLLADLITHFRNLLIVKADPEAMKTEVGAELFDSLNEQASQIEMHQLLELIEQFAAAEGRMKWAPNKKLHFEIALIKAVQTLGQATLEEVIEKIEALKNGDNSMPQRAPAVPQSQPNQNAKSSTTKLVPLPANPKAENVATPARVLNGTDLWRDLLVKVRKDRPLISSWIETGAMLELTEQSCLIGFPKNQTLSMESILRPGNKQFIEKLLSELAGKAMTFRCELRDDLVIAPPAIPEKIDEPPADPMEAFKNDPLIHKALEIFKGEIQPA
jgi:DNA polymerase-3 subunit gamma/tau